MCSTPWDARRVPVVTVVDEIIALVTEKYIYIKLYIYNFI